MSEAVVDLLEPVQVEQQHRNRLGGCRQRLLENPAEAAPVGQAGQLVGAGLEAGSAERPDVGDRDDGATQHQQQRGRGQADRHAGDADLRGGDQDAHRGDAERDGRDEAALQPLRVRETGRPGVRQPGRPRDGGGRDQPHDLRVTAGARLDAAHRPPRGGRGPHEEISRPPARTMWRRADPLAVQRGRRAQQHDQGGARRAGRRDGRAPRARSPPVTCRSAGTTTTETSAPPPVAQMRPLTQVAPDRRTPDPKTMAMIAAYTNAYRPSHPASDQEYSGRGCGCGPRRRDGGSPPPGRSGRWPAATRRAGDPAPVVGGTRRAAPPPGSRCSAARDRGPAPSLSRRFRGPPSRPGRGSTPGRAPAAAAPRRAATAAWGTSAESPEKPCRPERSGLRCSERAWG